MLLTFGNRSFRPEGEIFLNAHGTEISHFDRKDRLAIGSSIILSDARLSWISGAKRSDFPAGAVGHRFDGALEVRAIYGYTHQRIEDVSRPFEEAIQEVAQLPGFEKRSAENVIAEIVCNMDRFPSDEHLASWAGMCPGNNETGGKKKNGKTTKGSKWLCAALAQSAWAASRKKDSYFQAQYRRLAGRRGKRRALIAVGHSLLVAIYHVLTDHTGYKELGADYFDKLNSKRLVPYLVKRLQNMGYEVKLEPVQMAA